MNIPATLAACRAELQRQKEIEAKATPGPWSEVTVLDIWRKDNVDDGNGYDSPVVCQARNLNPARLAVAESFLDSVDGWIDSLTACNEEIATDDTESWGWQLTSAAALLGVEVVS